MVGQGVPHPGVKAMQQRHICGILISHNSSVQVRNIEYRIVRKRNFAVIYKKVLLLFTSLLL